MRRTILAGVALLATIGTSMADNGNKRGGFIGRDTRISGCIAIVDKVRDGTMEMTQWLAENGEEFADLQLELKKRKYAPEKAKQMMMGMAINVCMQNKGYRNKCVADEGTEDGDLQMMQTANVYACWTREVAEVPPPPPPPPRSDWPPPQPPPLTPPPMSPADLAQFNEDMATITLPPTSIYPAGNQVDRFGSCASHWQANLHFNRPPEVRQVLYSVRVARCMYRTGFGFFQAGCAREFPNMLNPRCYVRFG